MDKGIKLRKKKAQQHLWGKEERERRGLIVTTSTLNRETESAERSY